MADRLVILLAAVLLACGPTAEQRGEERRTYTVLLDGVMISIRQGHACGALEKKALATFKLATEQAEAGDVEKAKATSGEGHKIKGQLEACAGALPKPKELLRTLMNRRDEWIAACVVCASGQSCIRRDNELRNVVIKMVTDDVTDEDKQVALFDPYLDHPVCVPKKWERLTGGIASP